MSGFQILFKKWNSEKISLVNKSSTVAVASNVRSSADPIASSPSSSTTAEVDRLSKLAPLYLRDAVRPSSRKTYKTYWNKYNKFCEDNHLSLRKATSISMFLIKLAEESNSKSTPLLAKHGIKYFLKLKFPFTKCGTDTYYTRRICKAICSKFAKPVKKATALSSLKIKQLVEHLLSSGTFKDERSACFFLTQCILFGRFEEIANIKLSNVNPLPSGDISFTIEKAKNFNLNDARTSLMSKGQGNFDPTTIFLQYFRKVASLKSEWLFPNFSKGRNNSIVVKKGPVSYSNMLKLLREALDNIGLDGKKFSLHSIRIGAVSEAANKNVDRSSLARHTRWKNEEMINVYHKMSLEKRREIPASLNLYS